MGVMKTPGVYVVEKDAFPNSVVEVATAVPAFIGYTEKAINGNKSLLNKPWRITSMAEFRSFYGEAPQPQFEIAEKAAESLEDSAFVAGETQYVLNQTSTAYTLYYSMLLFFKTVVVPAISYQLAAMLMTLKPASSKMALLR